MPYMDPMGYVHVPLSFKHHQKQRLGAPTISRSFSALVTVVKFSLTYDMIYTPEN